MKTSAFEVIESLDRDITNGVIEEYRIEYADECGVCIFIRTANGWIESPWWKSRE